MKDQFSSIDLLHFLITAEWHTFNPCLLFVGFTYQGKDIVFRFIIEYSSLRDFYRPLGNNNRSIFI
jgi:hypothetical protein